MSFRSIYVQGFVRVAACTIETAIADPVRNAAAILAQAQDCHERTVGLAVFPELCVSGYALDDLFLQDALVSGVETALADLVAASRDLLPVLVVGAPLRWRNRLYNAAVVIHRGAILGVVPKSFLPNYREFYEKRHFAAGAGVIGETIRIGAAEAPFGTDLVFAAEDVRGFTLGVEICEDLWMPVQPAARLALAGATVLANLSGSPITIGRARARSLHCQSTSARCLAAYVYAAAGAGESTTDLSWDGHTVIHENGTLLAEGERFARAPQATIADVDLDLLRQERISTGSFDDVATAEGRSWLEAPAGEACWRSRRRVDGASVRTVAFRLDAPREDVGFARPIERFPFVPSDRERLAQDCYEAYNIQVDGLRQRLSAIGTTHITIGVSGGLDSTHALIVAARAFDLLGLPRSNILAYTMPGFATGTDTKANAHRLMASLGVTAHELDIRPAAEQMLKDLGHPYSGGAAHYDVTFENVQAGLRTDYLFRLANHQNAIVLGTGDLSELALGWCTYGVGDQMSHYNVNAGVPKTLIQHLIGWVIATRLFDEEASATLAAILATEISPELVPVAEGEKPQSTEERVGPYALQDFNLFYTLRYGFRPSKIAFLALMAWEDAGRGAWPEGFPEDRRRAYGLGEIRKWLLVFTGRFFGFAQFKRSALPNGPKVSAGGALSPRGDWRAPSDGNARLWRAEIEREVPEA